jgi:hypothetical protein
MPHDRELELAEALRRRVIGWRKAAMVDLAGGVSRGEVRPDVRVNVVRELGQDII